MIDSLLGRKVFLIGLDIGSSSVKLSLLGQKKGKYILKLKDKLPYEEQIFAENEILDAKSLLSYIKNVLSKNKVLGKPIAIHVPMASCFYTVISIDPESKVEESVSNYMAGLVSEDEVKKVKIEYKVLPVSINESKLDVAIAAVKKRELNERLDLLESAGLTIDVVDIEASCINNQFYLNHPDELANPVCLMDIGASSTKVVISYGGYPYVTRNVGTGSENIKEALQKEFFISENDAEKLKFGNDLKKVTYTDAFNKVILPFYKKVVTEAVWSTDDFKERFELDVSKFYLFGGGSKQKGLVDALKKIMGKDISLGKPLSFAKIDDDEGFDVSIGLSLRYKGDKNAKV